ncbi:MAG: carboxypeptidase-like regulatory domain-containing protein, partial [Acidobacteriota bacterium]|nr:carboxypeptidase-like regulatory domain-containing protein [Acidobacteriota bacterium]
PSTGSNTGGSLYSFGSTSSSERALGSLASGGTGTIRYGVRLKNDTGAVITSLGISFTGEQWRKSGVTVSHSLTFDYRQASTITDLTTGTFTSFSSLDFTSPVNTTTGSALDGNAAANRTIKAAIINVTIPVGEEIMLRWNDIDDTGSDHGLAIDDLSITPRAGTLAAGASLGGRIVTSNGRGIRNVVVIVSGNNLKEPKSAKTGAFGYYNFEDLSAGATYIVTVNSKRFGFQIPSRVITLHDQIADVDFIAEP